MEGGFEYRIDSFPDSGPGRDQETNLNGYQKHSGKCGKLPFARSE
jgi:hypothetical protein